MALKRTITKAQHEALEEGVKALYVDKDGMFVLDLDEPPDAAKTALDKERESNKLLRAELKAERDRLALVDKSAEEIEAERLRKEGDIKALETSYKGKLTQAEQAAKQAREADRGTIRRLMVDSTISKLAGELFTDPVLGRPHLAGRFDVDFEAEGGPALRILDAEGKPSALTEKDLRSEFLTNKSYRPILRATSASGGGAPKGGAGLPLPSTSQTPGRRFSELSPSEQTAYLDAKESESNGTQ